MKNRTLTHIFCPFLIRTTKCIASREIAEGITENKEEEAGV